ncbi:MAG: hypothetical protein QF684_05085 [Candidatus Thalassarchaeaceae archaeon]|jgi:hypothetical protein|nr:hypothetical protein [Candidatus Thalassarchaeaceae archaeon]
MNEFLITLEDRPGSMAECCEAIGDAGINIIAGAGLASSSAIAAIVTDDAGGTTAALESLGVAFSVRELYTATLRHEPGSLGAFTRGLAENGINLQSIYIMSTDGEEVLVGYSTA